MIEPTDEMKAAFRAAQQQRAQELVDENAPLGAHDILDRGLAAVLAIVARERCMERRGHVWHPLAAPTCTATVETRGAVVRCTKRPDGHDAHLGHHEGWDVVW